MTKKATTKKATTKKATTKKVSTKKATTKKVTTKKQMTKAQRRQIIINGISICEDHLTFFVTDGVFKSITVAVMGGPTNHKEVTRVQIGDGGNRHV